MQKKRTKSCFINFNMCNIAKKLELGHEEAREETFN